MDHPRQPSGLAQPITMETQKMNGLDSLLCKLPTELRFMILGDCIASGHPEFMRASRALQKDGQAIIYENGIYRMRFGAGNDENGQHPSQEVVKKIQNLDITANLMNCTSACPPLDRLRTFADCPIRRENCNAVLKIAHMMDLDVSLQFQQLLWHFAGFEKVALRIDVDKTKPFTFLADFLDSFTEDFGAMLERTPLEPRSGRSRFGEPEVTVDKNGFCKTFYPRKNAGAAAGGVEG